jgi:hypothetical protein
VPCGCPPRRVRARMVEREAFDIDFDFGLVVDPFAMIPD